MALAVNSAMAWEPDPTDEMELSVAKSILSAKAQDPTLANWFDTATAFVVFPRVGKAGIGIGGARGKGLVIQKDKTIGRASLTQLTIGLQLGGQVYAEYVFFRY